MSAEFPLDPVEELARAEYLVVTRKKAGLTPIVHLPDPSNPDEPGCQTTSRSGRGFKRYPVEGVEPEQVCGKCLGRDKVAGGRRGLSAFLEHSSPDVVGGST